MTLYALTDKGLEMAPQHCPEVGTRVLYPGDVCNQPRKGTVVEINSTKFGEYAVVLWDDTREEDGMRVCLGVSPASFIGLRPWKIIDADRSPAQFAADTAQALADLPAARQHDEAVIAAKEERSRRTVWVSLTDCAKLIRKALKARWPQAKFSVRCSRGCNYIDIDWVQTPGVDWSEVRAVASRYQGEDFDGMRDCYDQREGEEQPDGTILKYHCSGVLCHERTA